MSQQGELGFLEELIVEYDKGDKSKEHIYRLAEKHGLRPYQIENVLSFYKQNDKKVKICKGLPCRLKTGKDGLEYTKRISEEEIEEVSCLGYCDKAPVVWSEGKYLQVNGNKIKEINGVNNSGFKRIETLGAFLDSGGFTTLLKSIDRNPSDNVLKFVKELDLKGFGGSGFPAYVKWSAVSASPVNEKYLLVNAHEGEPGTFKDRVLMESNPFDLIEASLISALTVGASKIIIALKYEYRDAEQALRGALESSMEYLNDKLDNMELPEIRIFRIPGFYITGEESALMEAIEGRRSEPRLRPPYPAEIGLFGKPTLIDNVETLVYFLGRLKEFYATGGREAGGKVYCLTGDVENPGPYLLQYGTKSSTLVSQKGGASFSELKAVLPGGLSGGLLPTDNGSFSLDFDSLRNAGAGLGTGSMIAISKDRCMVDVMENVESFFERESCGKCMPCRYGTHELSKLFENLKKGAATENEVTAAKETAMVMLKGSICGLGQASAKMFLDSVKYFNEEIRNHTAGDCLAKTCFQEVER